MVGFWLCAFFSLSFFLRCSPHNVVCIRSTFASHHCFHIIFCIVFPLLCLFDMYSFFYTIHVTVFAHSTPIKYTPLFCLVCVVAVALRAEVWLVVCPCGRVDGNRCECRTDDVDDAGNNSAVRVIVGKPQLHSLTALALRAVAAHDGNDKRREKWIALNRCGWMLILLE